MKQKGYPIREWFETTIYKYWRKAWCLIGLHWWMLMRTHKFESSSYSPELKRTVYNKRSETIHERVCETCKLQEFVLGENWLANASQEIKRAIESVVGPIRERYRRMYGNM